MTPEQQYLLEQAYYQRHVKETRKWLEEGGAEMMLRAALIVNGWDRGLTAKAINNEDWKAYINEYQAAKIFRAAWEKLTESA